MQLEDYFSFLAPDDIRVKGTRVGIETILYEYIHRAQPPEAIAQAYSSVTLEQVYATILYYLHNEQAVTRYLADWLEFGRTAREEQQGNPGSQVTRLRELKAARESARAASARAA